MKLKHVIFDLDGTLIDSSDSILLSLNKSLNKLGIKPINSLSKAIVGPPLVEIIQSLIDKNNEKEVPIIIEEFKKDYDEVECINCKVFIGIEELLNELKKRDVKIYIATNKRITPAKKIIEYLGWSKLFECIYTLDSCTPILTKKEHILQKILEKYIKENLSSILFIGDRNEDVIAANSVNIPVIYAEWGYGEKDKLGNTLAKIKSPKELLKYLKNYQLISE